MNTNRFSFSFVIEVVVDYLHDVDIDGLWSQIYFYWVDGFQYWFDIDEIKAWISSFKQFWHN